MPLSSRDETSIDRRRFLKQMLCTGVLMSTASFLLAIVSSCAGAASKRLPAGSPSPAEILSIKTGFTNAYLLRCTEGFLLIDTGYADDYENFVTSLTKRDIAVEQIKYIFLTHHHDDHAGFATQLIKNSPVVFITHQNSLPKLKLGKNDPALQSLNACVSILLSPFLLFHDDHYPPVIVRENDIVVSDDDDSFLRRIGINGRIIITPGHTDDSMSIVLENGAAFVGDAAMDLLKICLCRHEPIFVEDQEQVQVSWKKLKAMGAQIIYPAHGDPFSINELGPI